MEEERMGHALIEATTAIELAIGERLRKASTGSSVLEKKLGEISEKTGVSRKAAAICALLDGIEQKEVEHVLNGIGHRNCVVHDGTPPSEEAAKCVPAMLRFVLRVLDIETRFVSSEPGQVQGNKTAWDDRRP